MLRRPSPGLVVLAIGIGLLAVGSVLELAPWYQAARWQASPEAARAERNAAAPQPTATPSTSDLRLVASSFAFDDPPQPGAHAHLDLSVQNPTPSSDDQFTLLVPTSWLAGYRLEAIAPSPVDGDHSKGSLRLTF